jgi:cell division protein FtsI/penicillin-binding protein 2
MVHPIHLRRVAVLGVFFALLAGAVAGRLIWLQGTQEEYFAAIARSNLHQVLFRESRRGDILDSRGNVLARCEPMLRVFANPRLIGPHTLEVARALAPVLACEEAPLAQRLAPTVRTNDQGQLVTNTYVNLKRKLTLEQWQQVTQAMATVNLNPTGRKLTRNERAAINNLRRYAIYATEGQHRTYPSRELAAHLLGFAQEEETNFNGRAVFDMVGRDGVEWWFNQYLTGTRGWRVTKTARGVEIVSSREQDVAARPGLNLVLSIDLVVQQMVEAALADAMKKHTPTSACAIVVRPRTGDILAMATLPSYDPNDPGRAEADWRRNRVISDIIEPGSTFKIVVVSGALNDQLVTLDDRFDCENGAFHYLGRLLRDHERYGVLSVKEIITRSSNIGAAKIGLKMGDQRLDDYVRLFGFGANTGIPLPGEVRGIAHPVRRWDKLMITRIPMGQAISVTPLQMVMSMAAIANDGRLMRPRLVRRLQEPGGRTLFEYPPLPMREAITPRAAKDMVTALKTVVTKDGTGFKAALEHYHVAGKTGTAQKAGPGGYQHGKYVASFIGFFPADDPELCIGVFLDEPHNGYYGGQVVAPYFKTIAEQVAQYLSIKPDKEELPPAIVGKKGEFNTAAVGAGESLNR